MDAPNHSALLGNARQTENKIREIKFILTAQQIRAVSSSVAQGASLRQHIGAGTPFF
jgi:hypothetical protein